MNEKQYDVFISNSPEDKHEFVTPLVNELIAYGVNVWSENDSVKIGDSKSRSRDNAVSNSNFAIVILSPNFLKDKWTNYELKSLISLEVDRGDFILPIWKDISYNQLRQFSPYLSDKFALVYSGQTLEEVVFKIIEVVKPNIFNGYHKKIFFKEIVNNPTYKNLLKVKYQISKTGPINHPKLENKHRSIIRVIRSTLWMGFPHSMEFWTDGFRRDLFIEDNLRFWEQISACFFEAFTLFDISSDYTGKGDLVKEILELIFLMTELEGGIEDYSVFNFRKEFIDKLKLITESKIPPFEKTKDSFS